MSDILKNISKAEVLTLASLVDYSEGQVVSKTLVQNKGVGLTLFAFAKGEGISNGGLYVLRSGEFIVMPANHPHAVFGKENFKMLLSVIFPES